MIEEGISVKFTGDATSLTRAAGQVNTALDKTRRVSGTAAMAVNNLSRVAQDAPFGFIAISNNLNPLLEGFQRLSIESKLAGQSLTKTLVQSLTGAGGLGLALGVVSAALTFASVGFGAWTKGFGGATAKANEHREAVKKAKEAIQDYVESLDDVNQAQILGTQNAQAELISLNALYAASQNQNISYKDRKRVVDELQEQYPTYFKNIKDEVILAGGAEAQYLKLSKAILNAAKARALMRGVDTIADELIVKEKQYGEVLQKNSDLFYKREAIKKPLFSSENSTIKTFGQLFNILTLGEKLIESNEEFNATEEEKRKLGKEVVDLLDRQLEMTRQINALAQEDVGSIFKDPFKGAKATPKVKVEPRIEIEPVSNITEREIVRSAESFAKEFEFALSHQQFTTPLPIASPILFDLTQFIKFIKAEELKEKLRTTLNSTFSGGAISGFAGIGESIGAALAAGASPIEAAGQAIIGGIGDLIQQIGKALIEYGVIKQGLDTILKSGVVIPGVTAIALGVAAVAIGSLLKNAFKPRKFANGGLVPPGFPNDSFPAWLSSGERVTPAGQVANVGGMRGGGGYILEVESVEYSVDKIYTQFRAVEKSRRRDR